MMMNSIVTNGKDTDIEKENRTGGSFEKEQLPENLADIKSLRSIFESGSIRKDLKQANQKESSVEFQFKTPPAVNGIKQSNQKQPSGEPQAKAHPTCTIKDSKQLNHKQTSVESHIKTTPTIKDIKQPDQKHPYGVSQIKVLPTVNDTKQSNQKQPSGESQIKAPSAVKDTKQATIKQQSVGSQIKASPVVNDIKQATHKPVSVASHVKSTSTFKDIKQPDQKHPVGESQMKLPPTVKDTKQATHKQPSVGSHVKVAPIVTQKDDHGEDMVDTSQPAMEDILSKFRQLELETVQMRTVQGRSLRKLNADEYVQRSASLDRKANLTYERKVKETSRSTLHGMTIDERLQAAKSKTSTRSTGHQLHNPPNKSSSITEIDSDASVSIKEPENPSVYNVSVDTIKRTLGATTVKQTVEKHIEPEEFPTEGTVQALLSRWKSMETLEDSNSKKKKKVRFGVDSSWLPNDQANTGNIKASKQIKSCLKPTTPASPAIKTDKDSNKLTVLHVTAPVGKKTSIHENINVSSKASESSSTQPLRPSNSINSQTPPPDIVSQVSVTVNTPEDELPPPSNTKALLEKFRAMQTQTSIW